MDSNSFKTKSVDIKTLQKSWFLVDAENKILGRLSSEIAKVLRGKNNAYFTPNFDCGDYVIVLNSDKIKLTGKKWKEKKYIRHTGYPGGQRETTPLKLKEDKSSKFIIERASNIGPIS